jgi:hypothetical protein
MEVLMKELMLSLLVLLAGACAHNKGPSNAEVRAVKTSSAVEFDNHCANGLCLKKKKVPCDPTITTDYKERRYCFSSEQAKANFLQDLDNNVRNAHREWNVMQGVPR